MKTLNDYMQMSYRMEIVEDKDEGGFVVSYPDLPGCITCGETLESAIENAQDAKKAWIEAALEDGVEIHEPDSLEDYSGQFKLRIPRSLHRSLAEHSQNMKRKPTHPGAVLLEDVIKPLGLTITEAAKMLGVSRKTLSEFVNEKAMLSPEMALRIAEATNTSPESWMNMQQKLTLWEAEQHLPQNVIPFPSVHSEEAAALQM